jgi:hypothetical protein
MCEVRGKAASTSPGQTRLEWSSATNYEQSMSDLLRLLASHMAYLGAVTFSVLPQGANALSVARPGNAPGERADYNATSLLQHHLLGRPSIRTAAFGVRSPYRMGKTSALATPSTPNKDAENVYLGR